MQVAIKSNTVYSFKLNSGEELIAKVIQAGGEFIQIEEPVSIAPSPQGMGLVPSIFTADPKGEFRLNTSSVSIYAETEDAVRMKYLEATTGIKVPDKKIVLG
jgi:citrate lyase synthetase